MIFDILIVSYEEMRIICSYAIDTFLEALPWAIESTMNFILHLKHTLYYVIITTDLKMAALCNSIKYS